MVTKGPSNPIITQEDLGPALAGKANAAHKHAVPGDLTATGTPSTSTFLNGAGAWATPTNTTYVVPPQAEIEAGTAVTVRGMSAVTLKGTVQRWVTGAYATAVSTIGQNLAKAADAAAARAVIGAAEDSHTHADLTNATGDVSVANKGKLVRIHPSWGKIFNYIDPNDVVDPKEFVSKNWVDAQTNSREPLSWSGTQAQYDALATKDPNRTYYVTG